MTIFIIDRLSPCLSSPGDKHVIYAGKNDRVVICGFGQVLVEIFFANDLDRAQLGNSASKYRRWQYRIF